MKILGVSGGVVYGALGLLIIGLHDIAVRTFPGNEYRSSFDARQTRKLVKLLVDYPEPVYVRVGKSCCSRCMRMMILILFWEKLICC